MANLGRAQWNDNFANYNCELPYGLTTTHVRLAVEDVYNFLHNVNNTLVDQGLEPLETLVLGNTLSKMLSELIVKRISAHCETLTRNVRTGGHPDLIPEGMYPGNSVLRAPEGIEVKTSKQRGGWQGHNPERGWLIIFRYIMEEPNPPVEERQPIEFVQILFGRLETEDWSLAERGERSRRTRTTSINQRGVHKLRRSPVYQIPDYIVAPNAALRQQYTALNASFRRA